MQIMLQLAAEQAARARGPSYIDPDEAKTLFSEKCGCAAYLFSEDARSTDLFHEPSALQPVTISLGNASRRLVRQPLFLGDEQCSAIPPAIF